MMKGRSEVGRGAGIYTVGVDYKLVRCRLLNNKAVRGGAVYALNANVTSVVDLCRKRNGGRCRNRR